MLPLHATQPPLYHSMDNDVPKTASRLPNRGQPLPEFFEKQVIEHNATQDHIIHHIILTWTRSPTCLTSPWAEVSKIKGKCDYSDNWS